MLDHGLKSTKCVVLDVEVSISCLPKSWFGLIPEVQIIFGGATFFFFFLVFMNGNTSDLNIC